MKISLKVKGAEIVVFYPGWYEDFRIVDGRYEVYEVPSGDYKGWALSLATERVGEQYTHYGCPAEKQVPVWSPDK